MINKHKTLYYSNVLFIDSKYFIRIIQRIQVLNSFFNQSIYYKYTTQKSTKMASFGYDKDRFPNVHG